VSKATGRLVLLIALSTGIGWTGAADAAEHRLGFGLHFWKSVDDLAKDFPGVKDSGVAWLGSYLVDPVGPLKFGLDLEFFPNGFGGSKSGAWSPQAFVLVGDKYYGGIGIGMNVSSSFENNRSGSYYLARVGIDFALLPRVRLDVNLNYQADAFNELDGANTSAITLGAIVRFNLGGDNEP